MSDDTTQDATTQDATTYHLVSPNGTRIVGTLERIYGCAGILAVKADGKGGFDFDHDGETKVYWEGQETVENDKRERIFIDTEGKEYPESVLTLAPDEE